jgi:hypothetical protein
MVLSLQWRIPPPDGEGFIQFVLNRVDELLVSITPSKQLRHDLILF